jgi:hypothetical protein
MSGRDAARRSADDRCVPRHLEPVKRRSVEYPGGGEHMKAAKTRIASAVAASGSLLCLIATVAAGVKWK